MKLKQVLTACLVGCLMVLVGCASNIPKDSVSGGEFRDSDANRRATILDAYRERALVAEQMSEFMQLKLLSGEGYKLPYGDADYEVYCRDVLTSEVNNYPDEIRGLVENGYKHLVIYEGRDAPSMSRNSDQAMMTLAAYDDCGVQLAPNGSRTALKAVVVQQHSLAPEGLAGAVVKRFLGSSGNGLVTTIAREALDEDCESRCSPSFMIGGNSFQVGSSSNSQVDFESNQSQETHAGTDTCPTGNCSD